MRSQKAFSMVEVLVTMVFLSMAFLPIYNLFSFGQRGTTNNLNEIAATNYASDLVNFIREIKFYNFEKAAGSVENFKLSNDTQIASFFKRIGLKTPPACDKPFSRNMEVRKYKGRDTRGPLGVVGWLSDLLNKRRSVQNFMVVVQVEFPRQGGGGNDVVKLYTVVMD